MDIVKHGNIVFIKEFFNKYRVFRDRIDAGRVLGRVCRDVIEDSVDFVYAIPRGGVPVGYEVAKALNSRLDLLICRKILIPWDREAGFGAVDPDGNIYVDYEYATYLNLSEDEIKGAIAEQLNEIKMRNAILRDGRGYPDLTGKSVILVDDGIAAGYTMSVAVRFVKGRNASRVYIAVPTCHLNSIDKLSKEVDLAICLNIRSGYIYAVADAYIKWRDLTDDDIMKYISGELS